MLIFWIAVFIISLIVLVKGADWLLQSSEKIGLALGLSPFIVGVVIVGLGTSFPELVSSIAAAISGVTEIITANAIGSNIANILLIVGFSAVIGGRLAVTKNLIDLDLPLLAVSTALFWGLAWDKTITIGESFLLLLLFVIYMVYIVRYKDEDEEAEVEKKTKTTKPKVSPKDYLTLVIGIVGLLGGAKYLIDSVIQLSEILNIGAGVIALVAVAFGTSLPELIVSIKAARAKKPEVALGNIFGSNVFNLLLVVGVPGIFGKLTMDEQTFSLGLPIMMMATILFVISGISRRIHVYEGGMYLVIYLFFIGKLFGLL